MSSQQQRRQLLHFMVNSGNGDRKVLQEVTQMSKRAISYNIKNIKEGKGPERRKSVRPKKLFGDDMRCLSNLALSHPKWSCKQLAAQLFIRRHITVGRETVRTSLKRSGITKWTAKKHHR